MKSLDIDAMSSAIKNAISLCGIEVLADLNRFQPAIMDFLPGSSLNTELQLLIFTIRIDVGKKLLKGIRKSNSEQRQILIASHNMLSAEYGFSQTRSANILESFVLALGWNKDDIPESDQSVSGMQGTVRTERRDIVKGSVIKFGRYMWRVLYINNENALLLSEEITDIGIPYNKDLEEVSWEESWIRGWLNDDFLRRFSRKQQNRIRPRLIRAESNPWYQTDAGNQTRDKVFLLSIAEAVRNFGDSGQLKNRPKNAGIWNDAVSPDGLSRAIDDEYNVNRQAMHNGKPTWWWLRSPGGSKCKAAYINADGIIVLDGEHVTDDGGPDFAEVRPGIRPAIWLRL